MMKISEGQGVLTLLLGAVVSWSNSIAPVAVLLVLFMIADYFTGIAAAPYRGEKRNSEKGFRGIVKKICMMLLVAMGLGLDLLLIYATNSLDIDFPVKFAMSALITVWLICNEALSILENIGDIGVNAPPFLVPLIQWVRAQTESKATIPEDEEKNDKEAL